MRMFLTTAFVAMLGACGLEVYPVVIDDARLVCEPHGGLHWVYVEEPDRGVVDKYVQKYIAHCRNGTVITKKVPVKG